MKPVGDSRSSGATEAGEARECSLSRRALLARGTAAGAGMLAVDALRGAPAAAGGWPPASAYDAEVPAAWFDLALELVRTTPGFSPPVASRAFGYAGVALYEAVVPGIPRRGSLAGRLEGLKRGPGPADRAHHWPTVANTALAASLRLLFPTTPSANLAAIEALEHRFATPARAMLPRGTYRRSVTRGADVARHIFAWSTTDGGHEAFLRAFPPYTPPTGPGLWVPTPPAFLSALQPHWGINRSFLRSSRKTDTPSPPPPYSVRPESAFHSEALECHRMVAELTPEQQAIARFWSDDPGQTPTPPGHSISILTQTTRALDLSLDRAAEAYAKVGIAVAEAFISCWRAKYHYNLLRPVTYIRSLIDPTWIPPLITPPFPEYTSGHSVQSAAAAQVLSDLFGDLAFTDHTHDETGLPPRSFRSFVEAAHEAAISRLYGGIHFRASVERGLQQGISIGKRVSALS